MLTNAFYSNACWCLVLINLIFCKSDFLKMEIHALHANTVMANELAQQTTLMGYNGLVKLFTALAEHLQISNLYLIQKVVRDRQIQCILGKSTN